MPEGYSSLIKLHTWVYFCEKHKPEGLNWFGLEKDSFCEGDYPMEVCFSLGCTEKPVCRDIKSINLPEMNGNGG